MTPQSTWIATYPKSGTTWVRFLLVRLLAGPFTSSRTVDLMMPSMHAETPWEHHLEQGGAVLATHKRYDALVAKYGPCVNGFVHVVRHPADVLVSEARYYCMQNAGAVAEREGSITTERMEEMFRDFLMVMLANGESMRHRRLAIGSWGRHAESWLAARERHPHVLLRYEDLQRDPVAALRRMANFFALEPSDAALAQVAKDCSASAMRGIQERDVAEGESGSLYQESWKPALDLGLRFVGQATVGTGFQLDARALEQLEARFGPMMRQLGYRMDPEEPTLPVPALERDEPLLTPA